jgi:hypothetical protein
MAGLGSRLTHICGLGVRQPSGQSAGPLETHCTGSIRISLRPFSPSVALFEIPCV